MVKSLTDLYDSDISRIYKLYYKEELTIDRIANLVNKPRKAIILVKNLYERAIPKINRLYYEGGRDIEEIAERARLPCSIVRDIIKRKIKVQEAQLDKINITEIRKKVRGNKKRRIKKIDEETIAIAYDLHYSKRWTFDEVANLLKIPPDTINYHLKKRSEVFQDSQSHDSKIKGGKFKSQTSDSEARDEVKNYSHEIPNQKLESANLETKLSNVPNSGNGKQNKLDSVNGLSYTIYSGDGKGNIGTFYLYILNQLKKLGLTPSQYLEERAKQEGLSKKEFKEALAAKRGCKPEELSDCIAKQYGYESLTHALDYLARYLGFESLQHYADCKFAEEEKGSVLEYAENILEQLAGREQEKLEKLLEEKGFENPEEYIEHLSKVTGYDLPKNLPQLI